MLLMLISVLVIATIGYLSYEFTDKKGDKKENTCIGIIIPSAIISLITIIVLVASFNSYIRLQQKLATIEQYKESIELYADKGVQEFKPGSTSATEFTDLKYNNYQTQIGEMIRDMRDVIVSYNKGLTEKQIRKDNIFFSWYIYLPKDMKTIKMADYIK